MQTARIGHIRNKNKVGNKLCTNGYYFFEETGIKISWYVNSTTTGVFEPLRLCQLLGRTLLVTSGTHPSADPSGAMYHSIPSWVPYLYIRLHLHVPLVPQPAFADVHQLQRHHTAMTRTQLRRTKVEGWAVVLFPQKYLVSKPLLTFCFVSSRPM